MINETLFKRITGYLNLHNIAVAVGVSMSLFHLYVGVFGTLEAMKQRSVHLLFVLVLIFLIYPAVKGIQKKRLPIYDWALILLSITTTAYLLVNYEYIAYERIRFFTPPLPIETAFGIILILLILEAARRTVGMLLTGVAAVFILYVFAGPFLPGIFYHPGVSLDMFLDIEYLTPGGIFGLALGISATYIVLFIIFGAFMLQTGFGEFLTDVATGLTGRTRGGPAKVAVFSSALFGTISGSASANVAITGTFTIPMMKKIGFKSHFAGAVEAAASTGGQLMPPIMGAAAFLMAEYTHIPYIVIIQHAAIPAILYFVALFIMVDLEAAKNGIKGMTKAELPEWKGKLLVYGHLIIPIILLLYLMAIGRTLFFAVTLSILAIFVLSFLRRATRLNPQKILTALWEGARSTVIVAIACAIAGLVIGTIQITGIGVRFSSLVVELSGGVILLGLVFGMIAALILGMGMPTSAAYLLMVALIIPALIKIGVPMLQAHFFAYYFACLSLITPPIATASYVAAGIAKSPMALTGWTSAKVAGAAYIVPFMFVFAPALLLIGTPGEITLAVGTALPGVYALALGLQGWGFINRINLWQRGLALTAAVLMMFPGWYTDIPGIIILALLYYSERIIRKRIHQNP